MAMATTQDPRHIPTMAPPGTAAAAEPPKPAFPEGFLTFYLAKLYPDALDFKACEAEALAAAEAAMKISPTLLCARDVEAKEAAEAAQAPPSPGIAPASQPVGMAQLTPAQQQALAQAQAARHPQQAQPQAQHAPPLPQR